MNVGPTLGLIFLTNSIFGQYLVFAWAIVHLIKATSALISKSISSTFLEMSYLMSCLFLCLNLSPLVPLIPLPLFSPIIGHVHLPLLIPSILGHGPSIAHSSPPLTNSPSLVPTLNQSLASTSSPSTSHRSLSSSAPLSHPIIPATQSPSSFTLIPSRCSLITCSHTNSSSPQNFNDGAMPFPTWYYFTTNITAHDEPSNFYAPAKSPEWWDAMSHEFQALP